MILTDINKVNNIHVDPIEDIEEAIELIKQLEMELKYSDILGIGLAANQIGKNKAVAIIRIPASQNNEEININLINPVLIDGYDLCLTQEGCLSIPNKIIKTIRYDEITIETTINYADEADAINKSRGNNMSLSPTKYEKRFIQLNGLSAIVVQHEMSHLYNLSAFDFAPIEIGRNALCPCGSLNKNKKCHNYKYYNKNLEKLFVPK